MSVVVLGGACAGVVRGQGEQVEEGLDGEVLLLGVAHLYSTVQCRTVQYSTVQLADLVALLLGLEVVAVPVTARVVELLTLLILGHVVVPGHNMRSYVRGHMRSQEVT